MLYLFGLYPVVKSASPSNTQPTLNVSTSPSTSQPRRPCRPRRQHLSPLSSLSTSEPRRQHLGLRNGIFPFQAPTHIASSTLRFLTLPTYISLSFYQELFSIEKCSVLESQEPFSVLENLIPRTSSSFLMATWTTLLHTLTMPEIAFMGDTMSDFIVDDTNDDVLRARILVMEDYGIDFNDHNHPIKAFQCGCGSASCRDMNRKGLHID